MRRVMFVTASYPTPEWPELGIFVKEHARAVRAAGAEVAVVHLDRTDVRRLHVEETGDDEIRAVRIRYPRSPGPLSYAANLAGMLAGWRSLRRGGFEPEIVHAHFFLAAVPAVALRPLHRLPVVVTEQWSVFLPDDPATLSPIVRRAAKFAFEHADTVMPVSDALRDGIRAAGIEARFHVVPNVYDATLFHPPAQLPTPNGRPARVVTVGAMYDAKGYEFLLEAVSLLAHERADFRVDVVGDGVLRSEYERLRHDLGLDELVTFHGWRTKADVAELLRQADLFVLTSRYDSNPCALIEALGTGLPAVATAVGGIPDMVGEGMGALAKPRDARSIAGELRRALDHRGDFDRMRIAERARERYGIERVGREFVGVYEDAISRRA
jgi:glycosyltransferase involved in cell wall biosynthesis